HAQDQNADLKRRHRMAVDQLDDVNLCRCHDVSPLTIPRCGSSTARLSLLFSIKADARLFRKAGD
ncbi:MAG TPA: hypothetical protein VK653_17010, partial [Xanthobacteraceae bacterium]|nr:hypothetical protein [Xanthobacteraceae bacterium]